MIMLTKHSQTDQPIKMVLKKAVDGQTTHLVTSVHSYKEPTNHHSYHDDDSDDGMGRETQEHRYTLCKRTIKYFLAVCQGVHIVSFEWVLKSLSVGAVVEEDPFYITCGH